MSFEADDERLKLEWVWCSQIAALYIYVYIYHSCIMSFCKFNEFMIKMLSRACVLCVIVVVVFQDIWFRNTWSSLFDFSSSNTTYYVTYFIATLVIGYILLKARK